MTSIRTTLLFSLCSCLIGQLAAETSQTLDELSETDQVVLFDRVHEWTQHTFTEVLETRPWGEAFAQGNVYVRYEIIDKPTDIEVAPMICLWQGTYGEDDFRENCTKMAQLVKFSEPGVYYAMIPGPGIHENWFNAYRTPRFSEDEPVNRIMHQWWVQTDRWRVLRRGDTNKVYDYGAGVEIHIPIKFRATGILVKKGARLDPPREWKELPEAWIQESRE